MRQLALALAAVAALSIAGSAHAAVVTTGYTFTTGDAGSGTFSVDFDTVAATYTLSAFDYTLGATTFTTANVSLQQTGGFSFVIGGNTNGATIVSSLGGADDFMFDWGPGPVFPPSTFTYYVAADIFPERRTSNILAFAQTPTGGVPEPATWAMMLLGFAGIGLATRRRKLAEMKALASRT
jgi:hypothetical protein